MRLPVDRFSPLLALLLLSACGGGAPSPIVSTPLTGGPAADYPIVLGPPFTVGGLTYTPADKMNVDEVGYAYAGSEGGSAISAAHRTLPVPSYVEVTSLLSGKTILVRVERRGPMEGDGLVELSPGAVAQLGADPAARTPSRVRRVNPPEPERAALRRGERAPARMDTPKSLVAVLLRKLESRAAESGTPHTPASASTTLPVADRQRMELQQTAPAPRKPSLISVNAPLLASSQAKPATSKPGPVRESRLVQVGAFARKANAEATAAKVGGTVSPAGRLWRVRVGPFAGSEAASAALAKVKAAGYSDARIQRAD